LIDTGVFDQDRYFDVFVEYAKASPEDMLIQITTYNRGLEAAELHVLPTLWCRNQWSWRDLPPGTGAHGGGHWEWLKSSFQKSWRRVFFLMRSVQYTCTAKRLG
jgi:hypothetical protein